jgi:hypothetical protein
MWQNAQRALAACLMIHPASRTGAGHFGNQDQGDATMTFSKNIISAVALWGIIFAGHAGASVAGDTNRTFKPLQGLSFDAGNKHGVGYFLSNSNTCKLVLTLADSANQDDQQGFTAARYEAAVPAGQNTRYTSEGHTFEFGCQASAEAMTFKVLSTVASE